MMDGSSRKTTILCRAVGWIGLGVVALMILFGLTLAMPVETWRTGQQSSEPLPILAPSDLPVAPDRIWIDADPACGEGPRTDPDDCLAIRHLLRHGKLSIAGVSTVFGNAPLETTDAIARELMARLAPLYGDVPVHRGAAAPMRQGGAGTEAEQALTSALSEGRLTIVALGPLTNVAAALRGRPELHGNVRMIVAVMGRRPGHIFHPAEGAGGGSLFGHGPVFRDFNVAQDPDAVAVIIGLDIPLVLVPYEVARNLEIDDRTLDQIAASGADGRWVAERARSWLGYWQTDIGREGFYPFDLLAALFVTDPALFACAPVAIDLRRDGTVFFPFSRMQSLLIDPLDADPGTETRTLYCHDLLHHPPTLGQGSAVAH